MSKFKVGDKVALKDNPYDFLGYVVNLVAGCQLYYLIAMKEDEYKIAGESEIVALQELPNMSDDEIYSMFKPKIDKAGLLKHSYYYRDHSMFYTDEVIGAIALAYRSGCLRAKKGRPFKIGGEKE